MVDDDEIKGSQIKHAGAFYFRSSERNGCSVHSVLAERNQQDNDLRHEM